MKQVRLLLGFGILLLTVLLVAPAMAAPDVVNNPVKGPPAVTVKVTGSDFGAYEAVDVFFDFDDLFLAVTDNLGIFTATIKVPASAAPGTHWITAIGRRSQWAAQESFAVSIDWPQHRYNSRRTGYNPYENVLSPSNVENLNIAWAMDAEDGVESSPAVANGKVYVGNWWGKLFAFDAATGALRPGWPVIAGGTTIVSSPLVYGSRLYVGNNGGQLYGFNANSGALLPGWPVQTGGPIESSPTLAGGKVYVGSFDGKVYAYNYKTGVLKSGWPAVTGGPITSSPAVVGGKLYVGSMDKKLYAFNASTGAKLWDSGSEITDGIDNSSPAVANDGTVYVGSRDKKLYAFHGANGSKRWDSGVNINSQIKSSPAVARGRVYIGSMDGKLYAFNARRGDLLSGWPVSTGGSILSSPAVANGVVYVGSADGNLYAFDAVTGALLWQGETGLDIWKSSPAVANGTVYIGSTDHYLYAFNLEGLDEGFSARSRRAPAGPPDPASLTPNYKLKAQQ